MRSGYRTTLYSDIFPFSSGIQFFGLKVTSQGKPVLKNSFLRSDLRYSEVHGEVSVQGHPVFQFSA